MAFCGGLFAYFHNGRIRRVQCGMKHFIPSVSSSSLRLRAHQILNSLSTSRISVAGKQRSGAKSSFICFDICLFIPSHLFAVGG